MDNCVFQISGYMLAGLWGAKVSQDRHKIRHLAGQMLATTPRHYWDFDQALLRRTIWPEAVKSSLQHDSYSCAYEKFNAHHPTQPFPTRRNQTLYVGWGRVKAEENKTGIVPCPFKCRYEIDWTYC